MTKKKKEESKEEEIKEKTNYDIVGGINSLEASEPLKRGFEYHLNHSSIKIKDEAGLKKQFEKFKKGV